MIKTIIADDDLNVLNILQGYLQSFNDVEVIGKTTNGKDLLDLTYKLSPQLVFADIDMPGMSGIEFLEKLNSIQTTFDAIVIFITGHPQYATKAFEVAAFDFIVKPFDIERIGEVLVRVRDRLKVRNTIIKRINDNIIPNKIWIKKKGSKLKFIDRDSIVYISRQGQSTVVHTTLNNIVGKKSFETRENLEELEKRLPDCFIRSHKSYIINLNNIDEITPHGKDALLVKFVGYNDTAVISNSNKKLFYQVLGIRD